MLIRDTFATKVNEKIEPIVKVADRKPDVVLGELSNLIVTTQWERYIHSVLDAYVDGADRSNEQGIGVWINGFFGSGKSLLMKVLGLLLEGGELRGQSVHDLFLSRLPANSPDRADIERFLTVVRRRLTTTAVGGNLHSMLTTEDDRLPLIVFRLFAEQRGYTHNWPFAWAIEYQIDERGQTETFRTHAAEYTGMAWDEIVVDPEFYLEDLYRAAAAAVPDHFSGPDAVERAVSALSRSGVNANRVIERLRRWCEQRDANGCRHKLWLQLDELGQWIAAGNANDRANQVQALVEEAAENGGGRVWLTVTAHGDVQALQHNVQQEQRAKIIQRFAVQCKLSNEDISQVVEERILRKTQDARVALEGRFAARSGEIGDLGRVERAQRVYPSPDAGNFALFYPYLPWTVTVVPDVVKGIAQAAKRDEALTGSNRTMIAVIQGALIESPDLLTSRVGRLVSLSALYPQLSADVAVETKTDLSRIADSVQDATAFTTQVAYGLFLLGQAQYIPPTLDNVTRTVVDDLGVNFANLRRDVKTELERLVAAGYAKQVAEQYIFLNTLQRSFQDKVSALREELLTKSYDLIQELQEYKNESALRFESVPMQGREMPVKIELDGSVVRNPTGTYVTVRVYSPLQRTLDAQINDDAAMRQRSSQEPDAVFIRMQDVQAFRRTLALAAATDRVSNEVRARQQANAGVAEVAQQARQVDLPELKTQVRMLLGQAVRGSVIFFRGTIYQLAPGDNAGEAVRNTLSQILPSIFPRFVEVTHRVANEQTAVRAALASNVTNADLRALNVYRADGSLNEGHALVSALRGRLPLMEQDQEPINAAELRREFEAPPYGWDGNTVKVGLALLLRASACRLIDSGQPIVDPSSPQAELVLATESRFRTIRVQGIRSELDPVQLRTIRDALRTLFSLPATPPIVAATLNNVLAEELARLASRDSAIATWSRTIQCPLPPAFQVGDAAVQELLNVGDASRRLALFRDQTERLTALMASVASLEQFQREHGATYQAMRDFFNSMVNAGAPLPALSTFLNDYRTVVREQSITSLARWNELNQSYLAAQQAVEAQIGDWRATIQQQLATLNVDLEDAVRAVGVPEERVREEAAGLGELYSGLRTVLERDARTYGETKVLLSEMTSLEFRKQDVLRELRELYAPDPPSAGNVKHVTWQALAGGTVQVQDKSDVEGALNTVRARLLEFLADEAVTTLVID